MKKVLLIAFLCCTFLWGCDIDTNTTITLTDSEMVESAVSHMDNYFENVTMSGYITLPSKIYVYTYFVRVAWFTNDTSAIDIFTGEVHNKTYEQQCTITAVFVYGSVEKSVDYNLTIPPTA